MHRLIVLLMAAAGGLGAAETSLCDFRIVVGLTDRASRLWEGELSVSGGELAGLQGWQFSQNDVARPNGKFEFRTKLAGRVTPEGLIARVRDCDTARVEFRTRAGVFQFASSDVPPGQRFMVLKGNGFVERAAAFNGRGLVSAGAFTLQRDGFTITIDGIRYSSENLEPGAPKAEPNRIVYPYQAGPYRLDVEYESHPEWSFLSKQLLVRAPAGRVFRVDEIAVFHGALASAPADTYVVNRANERLRTGHYGAFLRFADRQGLMVLVQNPFLDYSGEGTAFTVRYRPDMEWKSEYGPFASDRGCLGPYRLSGRRIPEKMTAEWKLAGPDAANGLDTAEVEAFTACVRAFLLDKRAKPLRIFVGWCVNDYQIDAGTPEGRAEYKRLIDRAAELGAEYVLYAPANSQLSRREESTDDWKWEYVLWLGLGQKIRKGEWNPKSDALPPSVREMLDYAASKRVKLVAYVYPVLPFAHNPEWLVAGKNASLGVRSFQDWLIENLLAFHKRTGIGGYAFDYTFLWFDGASRYAQWWGWRRVMETLRREIPDLAIDGRQLYQRYGPWTWLAGSYPHPTSTDEQPESFTPFPDLHLDRVSANRQRFTAWWYRNHEFCPSELMPGFITHQTPRSNDRGELMLTRFRARDWDYLGWRYSLLSSIATAGWNNVIDMIPARDLDEYRHFSAADKQFFRHWLDWADHNKEYLRHTRTILGQPAIGRADGTSAIVGSRGYVFLFNPNARKLTAGFSLDESIGLTAGDSFLIRELYPLEGRLAGGIWKRGEKFSIRMDGTSAVVLELLPAPAKITAPLVFNAPGEAELVSGTLSITGVRGETGSEQQLRVLLPPGAVVRRVSVNGTASTFTRSGDTLTVPVRFAGVYFSRSQAVERSFTIPKRVFAQLAARRRAWPLAWTEQDLRTPWLAPERLLLFVQIAEPDEKMPVRLRINGRPFPLEKAYSSGRPHGPSFVGFYADVSRLQPGRPYRADLELPPLKPGQFQGLFFDNVETEYTGTLAK